MAQFSSRFSFVLHRKENNDGGDTFTKKQQWEIKLRRKVTTQTNREKFKNSCFLSSKMYTNNRNELGMLPWCEHQISISSLNFHKHDVLLLFFGSLPLSVYHRRALVRFSPYTFFPIRISSPSCTGGFNAVVRNGGGFCLLFTLLTHMILVHSPNNKNQNRYEAKRQEIEAWLMRMEAKSERMGKAATQVDGLDFTLLDSQQKEQKVTFKNPENLANLSSPAARTAPQTRTENVLKLIMNNFSWRFSLLSVLYTHNLSEIHERHHLVYDDDIPTEAAEFDPWQTTTASHLSCWAASRSDRTFDKILSNLLFSLFLSDRPSIPSFTPTSITSNFSIN